MDVNNNVQNNGNNANNQNNSNKSKKAYTKRANLVIIILLILIIVGVLASYAYAKYTTTVSGSASAQVAQMICEIEVVPSEATDTIINPYCDVTVKNYNADDKVAETDISFKIEVTPKDNIVLPEYYWQDSNGTILAQSTEVTGKFESGVKEDLKYKIVFLNSGEEDITRLVDFNLVALQANE